jgi:hypothetical protein
MYLFSLEHGVGVAPCTRGPNPWIDRISNFYILRLLGVFRG